MPDHFLTNRYPTGLEELFTVVWWEQRRTGLSYRSDIPAETMTVDQFVADTLAMTNYRRARFGKERIYLMGHSWGSFIVSRQLRRPRSCMTPTLAWLKCRINSNPRDWRTNSCSSG